MIFLDLIALSRGDLMSAIFAFAEGYLDPTTLRIFCKSTSPSSCWIISLSSGRLIKVGTSFVISESFEASLGESDNITCCCNRISFFLWTSFDNRLFYLWFSKKDDSLFLTETTFSPGLLGSSVIEWSIELGWPDTISNIVAARCFARWNSLSF